MNSDLYFGGKKYISSSRAAKISGYVKDYIGQLCRDGKLECQMVGRSWYVSFESLVAHKNSNAVGTKNRTQIAFADLIYEKTPINVVDARLPASASVAPLVEVGQTLVSSKVVRDTTTISSLEKIPVENIFSQKPETTFPESIPSVAMDESRLPTQTDIVSSYIFHPKVKSVDHFYETSGIEPFLPKLSKTPVQEKSFVVAPVEILKTRDSQLELSQTTHHEIFAKRFPLAIVGAIALLIAFVGFSFSLSLNPEVKSAYFSIGNNVNQTVATVFGENESQNNSANVFDGAKDVFDSAGFAVYNGVNGLLFNTSTKILAMLGVNTPMSQNQNLIVVPPDNTQNSQPSQAMVVVPTTPQTDRDAVVSKIKSSFSDEVTVQPAADGSSGVITPVFKTTKGDDYLYVLVPIKN